MPSMITKSKLVAASFFAAVCIGTISSFGVNRPALAQASVRVAFVEMDENQDGKIDRAEFDRMMSGSIEVFSLDGASGEVPGAFAVDLPDICEADFADMPKEGVAPGVGMLGADKATMLGFEFERIDGNEDAQITFPEFLAFQRENNKRIFAAMDADGNGIVTPDEHNSQSMVINDGPMSDACVEALNASMPPPDVITFGSEIMAGPMDIERINRATFASADENMDGKLTLEEFLRN